MSIAGQPLYLTGGRQKPRELDEWRAYDLAVILRLDQQTGCLSTVVEYTSPAETCPDTDPAINFKAASIHEDLMYVSTNTEVLVYKLPSFERAGYLSLPWFNDVHHVCRSSKGNLFVVSTGLDMVGEVTMSGTTVREWAVLGGDTWDKFSRDTDYRKVPTTKPHASHPNYVIETGSDVWVSRANQKDVACLTQPERKVDFRGFPHDGVRSDGKLYFTTVNGFIHVVDERTMTLAETFDLNTMDDRKAALGWMRGILPVGEDLCWVGFTRLRPTKFKDNLSWVKHGFKQFYLPTRVALYDLGRKALVREIDLEPYGLNAVFSILPEPA